MAPYNKIQTYTFCIVYYLICLFIITALYLVRFLPGYENIQSGFEKIYRSFNFTSVVAVFLHLFCALFFVPICAVLSEKGNRFRKWAYLNILLSCGGCECFDMMVTFYLLPHEINVWYLSLDVVCAALTLMSTLIWIWHNLLCIYFEFHGMQGKEIPYIAPLQAWMRIMFMLSTIGSVFLQFAPINIILVFDVQLALYMCSTFHVEYLSMLREADVKNVSTNILLNFVSHPITIWVDRVLNCVFMALSFYQFYFLSNLLGSNLNVRYASGAETAMFLNVITSIVHCSSLTSLTKGTLEEYRRGKKVREQSTDGIKIESIEKQNAPDDKFVQIIECSRSASIVENKNLV